jgi:NAD(P)-dependent dehydrogenase (short-subunit alcohol dehydrogenase family)
MDLAARDGPEFGKQYALKNIINQTVSRLRQPMVFAAAVCFLASPLADFMTGTTFRIDGGSTPTV